MPDSGRKCGKKGRHQDVWNAGLASYRVSDKEAREVNDFLGPSECLTLPIRYSEDIRENGNGQEQSLLFSKLPGEIRNRVFELVCLPYDDPKHLYKEHDYWYRPGYHAKHITRAIGLLLSCRRAWIEANDLPMKLSQPTFWFKDVERTPEWTRRISRDACVQTEDTRLALFTNSLTLENRRNFQSLRVFAQMYWLEHRHWRHLVHENGQYRSNRRSKSPPVIWPRQVIFAVRNTDWWFWENDNPLSMEDQWIPELLKTDSFRKVDSFVLELEVLDTSAKLMQLDVILDRIKTNHAMVDNWVLQPGAGAETLRWTRSGNIDGTIPTPDVYKMFTKLDYRVFRLEWIQEWVDSAVS